MFHNISKVKNRLTYGSPINQETPTGDPILHPKMIVGVMTRRQNKS